MKMKMKMKRKKKRKKKGGLDNSFLVIAEKKVKTYRGSEVFQSQGESQKQPPRIRFWRKKEEINQTGWGKIERRLKKTLKWERLKPHAQTSKSQEHSKNDSKKRRKEEKKKERKGKERIEREHPSPRLMLYELQNEWKFLQLRHRSQKQNLR